MATTTSKTHCIICEKEKATSKCSGCLEDFCFNHLVEHRQQLSKQLDDIENKRNLLRQSLTEQTTDLQKHVFLQEINQWENESIQKIRQTAEETRQMLVKYTNENVNEIEVKLAELTKQLQVTREENDFNELELNQLNDELKRLGNEVNHPRNISIQEDPSSSFISKISVVFSVEQLVAPTITVNTRWSQKSITVAGGKGHGSSLNQLSYPRSIYVDDEQTVYIADRYNHRIVAWKNNATSGQVVAGGNGQGNRNDQLNDPVNLFIDKQHNCLLICDYNNRRLVRWSLENSTSGETILSNVACRDVFVDKEGYIYVSDNHKHEVRRWKLGDTYSMVVAGGNGQGNRLDQLNKPHYIFVDEESSVYVSDRNNNRVMKWMKGAKQGIIVAGGQGQGNSLTQLSRPRGIFVDAMGTVYVADQNNHRIMCWPKGANQGSVIVGDGESSEQVNQFNSPCDLSFDKHGNLYVLDANNHRVQKFTIE